eukprot:TRINITY_DN52946_c0_g1_i1.p1 TRINITY_DN52946_c0_g1~~TRINITY_DN52946_c0_g1_i1.p1  ORF type:complete len:195 (-),score=50.25 TRINITY_DN52946_c0_g1_i1:89-673(-)
MTRIAVQLFDSGLWGAKASGSLSRTSCLDSVTGPGAAHGYRRHVVSSFVEEKKGEAAEEACAKERAKEKDIEDEAKEASADVLAYSAREHAIHEAWKHSQRANELAKESAEAALEAANESMEARRILDQHDIISIETQTQADVAKAEAVRGLEYSPWPLAALSAPLAPAECRAVLQQSCRLGRKRPPRSAQSFL